MNDPSKKTDPPNSRRGMYDEADIGSGEKSPGQHETEEMIRQIPPLPYAHQPDGSPEPSSGRPSGDGAPTPDRGKPQASDA